MRTAWISSVIFSFVAVLGVGGFSFFLISSKSEKSEPTVLSQEVELADNQVFASAILPRPRDISSPDSSATAAVPPKDNKKAASEDDYEIFESEQASILDVVADSSPADSGKSSTAKSLGSLPVTDLSVTDLSVTEEVIQVAKLSSRKQNNHTRLSFRGLKADADDLSRRVVTGSGSDNMSPARTARAPQTQSVPENEIPAEMEPDEQISANSRELASSDNRFESEKSSDSDIDDLAALNKFNSQNNFQPAARTRSTPNKSLDNLLVQDDGFSRSEESDELADVDKIKNAISDVSVGLLGKDNSALANVRDDVIAIIVNRDNNENISMSDVKNIYVDKRINWGNGGKIITYNLPLDSDGREIFSQSVLDMSAIQAATEASNRVITNASYNRTHTKADRLVISYVSRNPLAIGYVPLKAAKLSSKVRIILTMQP